MIKAIETRYAGHKFRSRLEARWAVLLDQLEIEWLYEHQGYDIDGKWYLPDFEMPGFNAFLEVKGPQEYDHDMLYSMSCQLGKPIYMAFKSIPDPDTEFGYLKRVNKEGFVDHQFYECGSCCGYHIHEVGCNERAGYTLREAFTVAREEDFKSGKSRRKESQTIDTINTLPPVNRVGLLSLRSHSQNVKKLEDAAKRIEVIPEKLPQVNYSDGTEIGKLKREIEKLENHNKTGGSKMLQELRIKLAKDSLRELESNVR